MKKEVLTRLFDAKYQYDDEDGIVPKNGKKSRESLIDFVWGLTNRKVTEADVDKICKEDKKTHEQRMKKIEELFVSKDGKKVLVVGTRRRYEERDLYL